MIASKYVALSYGVKEINNDVPLDVPNHPAPRSMGKVKVVVVADEPGRVVFSELLEERGVGVARSVGFGLGGNHAVLAGHVGEVLREGGGALEARVAELGVLRVPVRRRHDRLERAEHDLALGQEARITNPRRHPRLLLGRRVGAALLGRLLARVQLHGDLAHLADEARHLELRARGHGRVRAHADGALPRVAARGERCCERGAARRRRRGHRGSCCSCPPRARHAALLGRREHGVVAVVVVRCLVCVWL